MTFAARVRYWLPLLPLLGLLAASYWLNQQVLPEPPQPDSNKRHDPDAIVENFSATKLNAQGTPSFIMAAKKMLHYPDDNSTMLEAPHITLLPAGQPAMHATAQRGVVSRNGDEVLLHDNVEISREANAQHDALTVRTDYLHILPEQNLADTDHAVTIIEARNIVQAVGMKMDNNKRTLKLLSQVRSEHAPIKP
ncbi:MAG: LPS export ABC transporter periplasmic protein LptC [Nitrosomonadales bacterium]|nr:LPS export ABC transporter periplasmic protein LptC [Nitrosomonadales bacterium]